MAETHCRARRAKVARHNRPSLGTAVTCVARWLRWTALPCAAAAALLTLAGVADVSAHPPNLFVRNGSVVSVGESSATVSLSLVNPNRSTCGGCHGNSPDTNSTHRRRWYYGVDYGTGSPSRSSALIEGPSLGQTSTPSYVRNVSLRGLTCDTPYVYRARVEIFGNKNGSAPIQTETTRTPYLDSGTVSFRTQACSDNSPPTPNPMSWSGEPGAASTSSITMTAASASDPSGGVQYQFDLVSGSPGGNGRSFNSERVFTDSGLGVNTRYCYNVRARDGEGNVGSAAPTRCAYTAAAIPPAPSVGSPTRSSAAVTIRRGTNPANTQFAILRLPDSRYLTSTGAIGSTTPVWQTSTQWGAVIASGLAAGSRYEFRVRARSGDLASTQFGAATAVTTLADDSTPPTPNPLSFSTRPNATSTTSISMTAALASDPSGPVRFFFDHDSGGSGGSDSTNQVSRSFVDSGLTTNSRHCYRVRALDGRNNAGGFSSARCAYTRAAVPTTPTLGTPTRTTVTVDFASGSNPSGTQYAIQRLPGDSYLSASGTGGASSPTWRTKAEWGVLTATGLSAGTRYEFRLKARNGDGITTDFGSSRAVTTAAADTSAPTPNPLTFSSPPAATSTTSITMAATQATDPSGPVEYFFDHTSGGGGGSDSTNQSSRSYTDGGLSPDSRHCYKVRARDAGRTAGQFSGVRCAFTLAAIPSAPSVGSVTRTTVAVNVLPGLNPSSTQYAIQRLPGATYLSASGAGGATSPTWQTDAQWGAVTATGLTAGVRYEFRVLARNGDDIATSFSPATAVITGAPDTSAPSPNPLRFSSPPIAVGTTALSMTATLATDPDGAVQYLFDHTSGGSGGSDSSYQSSRSFRDLGLGINSRHCYRVRARDVVGNAGAFSSERCAFTLVEVPVAPRLSAVARNSVALDIARGNNPVSTQFAVRRSPDGNYLPASDVGSSATPVWQSQAQWGTTVVSGLDAGTRYAFAVLARNGDGVQSDFGPAANVTTVATDGAAPSPDPMTFAVVPNGESPTAIAMSATQATDEDGTIRYQFRFSRGGNGGSDSSAQASRDYTDGGLEPNTRYCYTVSAADGAGNTTAPSSELCASTRAWTPSAPLLVPVDGTSVTVDIVPNGNPADTQFAIKRLPDDTYLSQSGDAGSLSPTWQTRAQWGATTAGGLASGSRYQFVVVARDKDGRRTGFGQPASIVLGGSDTTAPSPSPMTWATRPNSASETELQMVASEASDDSGTVRYLFDLASGGSGGSSSGEQASRSYRDADLAANTEYCYRVRVTDPSGNTTAASPTACAYTAARPPGRPQVTLGSAALRVEIDTNGNPPNTEFALFDAATNDYVASDGSSGNSRASWLTAARWSVVVITLPGSGLRLQTKARNGDGAESAPGPVVAVNAPTQPPGPGEPPLPPPGARSAISTIIQMILFD